MCVLCDKPMYRFGQPRIDLGHTLRSKPQTKTLYTLRRVTSSVCVCGGGGGGGGGGAGVEGG